MAPDLVALAVPVPTEPPPVASEEVAAEEWIDDRTLDEIVWQQLPEAAKALTPEALGDAVQQALHGRVREDEITFADVRRAVWRLVGRSKADFTSDWRVYRHGS